MYVVLVGSFNNACSLAAVVSRCPALGVTMQTLLHELPQVLLLLALEHDLALEEAEQQHQSQLQDGKTDLWMEHYHKFQSSWICSFFFFFKGTTH